MRVLSLVAALALTLALSSTFGASPARVANTDGSIALKQVADISGTTAMALRTGDQALYVTTQAGKVIALRSGAAPVTVLDLTGLVRVGGERGLLGLAFAPDGKHLYVHYSGIAAGETVLAEYAFANGRADPASARVLLTQAQPQLNHNGGQIVFGPDGYLYLGLGDGGAAGDRGDGHAPGGNGQSLSTLLGKILRIDPHPSGTAAYTIPHDNPFAGTSSTNPASTNPASTNPASTNPGARPEIYVYGLRNPWRFSFDTKTGDLWIADVGQDKWEEVDRLHANAIDGKNLGWNLFEGTQRFRDGPDTPVVMPVLVTSHADGNCSITGGYVYRGTKIPALEGWYLYSDYCNGTLMAAKVSSSGKVQQRNLGVEVTSVSSFGQDANGELYVLSQDAGVYQITGRIKAA